MPYSKIGWLSKPASQALAYLEAPPSRALPITARSCRFLGLLACEIGFEIPLKNRHLGVAGLLQSLRSNVVGPHTHACRFPWDVGLQVGGAQKHFRSGSNLCRRQVRTQRSLAQHRWRVPSPKTSERSEGSRAAYTPAGEAQHKSQQKPPATSR